ncbi:MAG: PepSY domain-containing protein [Oscillospiraceae bacterium]|nr:PepSY domain-containing protein [Oscillospiraceae bacterium]
MDKRRLENKISSACDGLAPDILASVLSDCKEKEGKVIMLNEKKKKASFVKYVAGIAAALAILLGGAMGVGAYTANKTVNSRIMLDVNPSIEISVNKNEKVLGVTPLNADAKKIVGTMDFSGSSLDVTLNALIGSMLRNGYISEAANSILVTVDSKDLATGQELQSRLMGEINSILESSKMTGAVLAQTVTEDSGIKQLAEQYAITEGKAKLINQIVSQNPIHTFEELAPLTINELNLLSESGNVKLENIASVGRASDSSYIGEAAAKSAAYKHAGVDETSVKLVKCVLDWEDGAMVYEIEFFTDDCEYDCDINAKTGAVVKYEKEQRRRQVIISTPENTQTPASNPATSYIGEAAAKSAALSHAGVSESSVKFVKCEFDYENGVAVYDIDFYSDGYEYDYHINATTGEVVKHSKETDDDYYRPSTAPADKPVAPVSKPETPANPPAEQPTETPTEKPASSGSQTSYISASDAKSVAMSHAGVSSVYDYDCELDYENGVAIYEISFDSGGYEYDYDINAVTGAVIRYEKDRD